MKTRAVYLLHFDPPYKQARHYLGSSRSLEDRLASHVNGSGARLVQVAVESGSRVILTRVWTGDRKFERVLKSLHSTPRLCPICNPGIRFTPASIRHVPGIDVFNELSVGE